MYPSGGLLRSVSFFGHLGSCFWQKPKRTGRPLLLYPPPPKEKCPRHQKRNKPKGSFQKDHIKPSACALVCLLAGCHQKDNFVGPNFAMPLLQTDCRTPEERKTSLLTPTPVSWVRSFKLGTPSLLGKGKPQGKPKRSFQFWGALEKSRLLPYLDLATWKTLTAHRETLGSPRSAPSVPCSFRPLGFGPQEPPKEKASPQLGETRKPK